MSVLVIAWGSPAGAEEEAGRPLEAVARDVRAAFDGEDSARLARLAREVPPDPWLVADLLCAGGHFDAAIAYAQAAPRPSVAALPTYVDLRRKQPTPAAWRAALVDAERLLGAGQSAQAHARLDGLVDSNAIAVGQAEAQRTVTSVRMLAVRGRALAGQDLTGAGIRLVEAAHVAHGIGWRHAALRLTHEATRVVAAQRAEHAATIYWQSAFSMVAQMNVFLGEYEAAAPMLRARLDEALETQNWMHAHDAGLGLGRCLIAMGHLAEAEGALEEAHRAATALGFDLMVATALSERSVAAAHRGETRRAVSLRLEAAEVFKRLGSFQHEEQMRMRAAHLWRGLAEYPRALALFDECLRISRKAGHPRRTASVLSSMGVTYKLLGNPRKAREHMEQALALVGELGQPSLVASILLSLADLQLAAGDAEHALGAQKRALELYTLDENPGGIATACANIGLYHAGRGAPEEALAWRRRALETAEKYGRVELRAKILLGTGEILRRLGRYAEGLALVREAASEAERLEMPDFILSSHRARARLLYESGHHAEALGAAQAALAWVPRVMGGLAEEESAGVRERSATLFDVGVLAAWKLGRPDQVLHFQESGRAGGLLESLGGRERLRGAAIPAALAHAEAEARAREARAVQRLRDAVHAGRLKPVRAARKVLAAERAGVEQIVERIQRETKAAADLVYPKPIAAGALRKALRPRDALVLYTLLPEAALATVVTRGEVRVVDLGAPAPIVQACVALGPDAEAEAFQEALGRLRAGIAAPLRLPAETATVMISPSGPLCYAPLASVFASQDVTYVPSGTVFTHLAAEARQRGRGILALGDPVYDGGQFARLPQTRIEVEALGTTVLVGEAATEAGLFEAARARPRWRAVHLACHGLVDVERPMRSALALTADEHDDGRLTVLDVLRRELPTDLAVLSACETGRGRVFRGEGIVGLTRAFMVAGAPRVLCSLWKVDDAATRALMTAFYERWNPRGPSSPSAEGGASGGPSAARALRDAQAVIRAQPKWSHPQYWAAWVLWGVP